MKRKRLNPKTRASEILTAALIVAERDGFAQLRQAHVADAAGCGYGTVSRYFPTIVQLRRAIMRAAITTRNLPIIAEGLAIKNPDAQKAPEHLKIEALKTLR